MRRDTKPAPRHTEPEVEEEAPITDEISDDDPPVEGDDDVFDLDNVTMPDLAAPGVYVAQVSDIQKKDSASSGNPMLVWEFTVLEQGDVYGKTFLLFTALTPAAMWKLHEVLSAFDLVTEDGKAKFRKQDVLGRDCRIVLEHSTYEGRQRASIKTVLRPEGEAPRRQSKPTPPAGGGRSRSGARPR